MSSAASNTATLRTAASSALSTLRKSWVYLALFVVSYVGFLAYFYAPSLMQPRSNESPPVASENSPESAKSATRSVVPKPHKETPAESRVMSGGVLSVKRSSERIAPTVESQRLTVEATQEMNYLSGRATNPTVNIERARAIAKLRSGAKTPDAVQALAMTIVSDQAVGNRLLAVTALRSLSRQGDDDGAIRLALQQAMGDNDAKVVQFARAAHDEVAAQYAVSH